ncbi:MAG TPA: hypothetical protein VJP45_08245 [Candidatus Limnocylindria bacterium]|nr:hypothetical protein [Candidatus Limnocylindria bacterium]
MALDFEELVEAANEVRFRRDGLRLQGGRWRTAEHDLVDDDLAAFEAELFAVTLHQLRRATLHALSATGSHLIRSAIAAFDDAVPHMEDIRDVLTHFDAYLRGEGNLQKDHRLPTSLSVNYGSTSADTTFIEIGPLRFNTGVAVPAADQLAKVALDEIARLGGPRLS